MLSNVKCPYCGKAFILNRETYESYQQGIALGITESDDDGSVIINCNVCLKPLRILMVDGDVQSIKKTEGDNSHLSMKDFAGNGSDAATAASSSPRRFKKLKISEFNTVIFPSKYSRYREILTVSGVLVFALVYVFFIVVDNITLKEEIVGVQKSVIKKAQTVSAKINFNKKSIKSGESNGKVENVKIGAGRRKEFNPSEFFGKLKNIVDKHNEKVKKQDEVLKKIEDEI